MKPDCAAGYAAVFSATSRLPIAASCQLAWTTFARSGRFSWYGTRCSEGFCDAYGTCRAPCLDDTYCDASTMDCRELRVRQDKLLRGTRYLFLGKIFAIKGKVQLVWRVHGATVRHFDCGTAHPEAATSLATGFVRERYRLLTHLHGLSCSVAVRRGVLPDDFRFPTESERTNGLCDANGDATRGGVCSQDIQCGSRSIVVSPLSASGASANCLSTLPRGPRAAMVETRCGPRMLASVAGRFDVPDTAYLNDATVLGDVVFANNPDLETIDLSSLVEVDSITLAHNPSLQSIKLDSLTTIHGDLIIYDASRLTSVILPILARSKEM